MKHRWMDMKETDGINDSIAVTKAVAGTTNVE